jgi:type II secretion system protein N
VKRGLKIAGYVAWFNLMFVIGVYLTFPLDDLKPQIVAMIEDALGKGKQGQYGVDPKIELGSLSLSGFGVSAERVALQLGSRDPEPGPTLDIDELSIGVRPWTLLSSARSVVVDADLYDGSISGVVSVDEKGAVHSADVEVDDVDLGKVPMVLAATGLPMTGKLNADIDLDLGATPEKDGEGNIKLNITALSIGPGSPKAAAAFGGFALPQVELGTLSGEIPVKQGRGELTGVKLDGKDLQLELGGSVAFKGRFGSSRLDLDGWFMPQPALFEKDTKLKSLIEIGESMGGSASLGKAKDADGRYHFSVKGTLSNPNGSLARDGKRAAKKAAKAKEPDKPVEKAEPEAEPENAG